MTNLKEDNGDASSLDQGITRLRVNFKMEGKKPEVPMLAKKTTPEKRDLKRKKDALEDDNDMETQNKKARVVTETSVPWEKLLEQATKSSKVENMCKFECQKCNIMYKSKPGLTSHFSKTGHGKNNIGDIRKCVMKLVAHKCKVCSKLLMCDTKVIQTHIKVHKIESIKEYKKLKNEKVHRSNKISNNKKVEMEKNDNSLENSKVSEELGNLCKYKCPTCKQVYNSAGSLRKHFLDTRHADLSRKALNSFLTKIVAHICKICSMKVLCDKMALYSHMFLHGIKSLKEYITTTKARRVEEQENNTELLQNFCKKISMKYQITGAVGSLCRYTCDKCDYFCQTWPTLKRHCSNSGHGPLSPATKYLAHVVIHKCKVCDELLLADKYFIEVHLQKHQVTTRDYVKIASITNSKETWYKQYHKELKKAIRDIPAVPAKTDYSLQANSLPESNVTKHLGDISFFKCPHCSTSGISYNSLLAHCRTKHNISCVAYDQNLLEEARYHQCHICSENLLCDSAIVRKHLGQKHGGMNLSEYKTEHVFKNGYIDIPNFKVYMTNGNVFKEVKITG